MSNHKSFIDFLVAMLTVYPRRLNAVAAQKFFYYRPLNVLLPIMGCIPKNLFDPDVRSVLGIFSVIKNGGNLLIFPEGRCSVDGSYMGINKATGKLVKKLNVPVVSCHIEGSYICMPFWRKGVRLGRVRVTLANLFDTEDTRLLDVDEINRRIDCRLSGSDTPAPSKPFQVFRAKRLAEGLENIIYYCPVCEKEFTLETQGNTIRCSACGATAEMDRYAMLNPVQGGVLPETLSKWYEKQAAHEMRALSSDMEPVKAEVIVRMPLKPGQGVVPCGNGELQLDPEGWRFDGTILGEDTHLFFPIDSVPAIPFDPKDDFQIYAKGRFYMFTPVDNPQKCAKYAVIGECAYWRFSVDPQMTYEFGIS
ncbi:MAG: 1-acyl-sn-glycerol-3-phosphate acyltransferase [Oscillospiraceae bacterium]|nr:1-acyl-sn-glycerol-3-phosphate acyltransferase [Oscillospiraceae bacterium]